MMEKAIWLSRHKPVPKEIDDLQKKGIIIIEYVNLVPNAEFIISLVKKFNAKYVIPVLPLSIIAKLVEYAKTNGFIILYAEMEKIHEGDCKDCNFDVYTDTIDKGRHFRFKRFRILKDIQIIFEDW